MLNSTSFDGANHQVGTSYDANGNPTNNGPAGGTNNYDVENRLIQTGTGGYLRYSYDPSGKRVAQAQFVSGNLQNVQVYFYSITGQRLGTYQISADGTSFSSVTRNLYFGGKLIRSAAVTVATDRLGSVRANVNGERFSYWPYGQERTSTSDGREKFGTYFRDMPGQDYADQRYYNGTLGRFWTPDPSSGSNAADPESWNKYTYTGGDPVNRSDPRGREWIWSGTVDSPAPDGLLGSDGYGGFEVCGSGWVTDASLSGPCGDPCNYGNSFVGVPGVACQIPVATPAPPSAPPPPSCTINFQYRGVYGSDSGSGGFKTPFLHGYLDITSSAGSFIAEGYTPDSNVLDAWTKPVGMALPGDNPSQDHSAGSISGAFVCDWIPTIINAVSRVDADKVAYQKTGPNSNTALYYFLSQLPTTVTPWFNPPSSAVFRGFYDYDF